MNVRFPYAFEDRMRHRLGQDWENFASAHATVSPTSVRINPLKRTESLSDGVLWSSLGGYLENRPVFTLDPTFHAGAYYVQEASSMFLEQALTQTLDLSKPVRILDLCAAPGGKSTHLLSLISRDSLLVCNDVIQSRTGILSENIQKWGHANVVVTNNDPRDFRKLQGYFDAILVDAPCSGEGLFRKDPYSIREWSPENVKLCAQRQRRILEDSWPALKQNGILIYCSCTYNEQENEDTLNWLRQQKEIEPVRIKISDSWGIDQVQIGKITGYRFYPHRTRGEGFFMSVVRKVTEEPSGRIRSKSFFARPSAKASDQLKDWIKDSSSLQFIVQEDLVLMIPSRYSADIEFLAKELRILTKGTALASSKNEKLIPEHASALSLELKKENFITLELDRKEAVLYLRKEMPPMAHAQKGFALVTFEQLPLGWVNLLGNRINNLYPSGWRIRMGPKAHPDSKKTNPVHQKRS